MTVEEYTIVNDELPAGLRVKNVLQLCLEAAVLPRRKCHSLATLSQ